MTDIFEMVNGTDWRLQTQGSLSEDWKSPWTGDTHLKGSKITVISIIELTKKKHLTLPIPNATASCLNISKKTWLEARELRKASGLDKSIKNQVSFRCDSDAIDYLELIMQSIVFAFTALEAFVNEIIPSDFRYEKKSKKATEIYTKEEIERWVSIDEKLDKIIPTILKVGTPKGRDRSWQGFKDLKNIRDRLIHMKSDDRKSSGPEAKTIWTELMKTEPPYILAFTIVKYFIGDQGSTPSWFQHGSTHLKK